MSNIFYYDSLESDRKKLKLVVFVTPALQQKKSMTLQLLLNQKLITSFFITRVLSEDNDTNSLKSTLSQHAQTPWESNFLAIECNKSIIQDLRLKRSVPMDPCILWRRVYEEASFTLTPKKIALSSSDFVSASSIKKTTASFREKIDLWCKSSSASDDPTLTNRFKF